MALAKFLCQAMAPYFQEEKKSIEKKKKMFNVCFILFLDNLSPLALFTKVNMSCRFCGE